MNGEWRNEDDFLKDIVLYSVANPTNRHAPPPTVLEYKARLSEKRNDSIYDMPPIQEHGVTLVNTGRGRTCFSTYRVGYTAPEPDDMEVIRRKLKEVNGLGFSNELDEANYRRRNPLPNKPSTPVASSTDDEMFVDAVSQASTPTKSPSEKQSTPAPDCSGSSSPSSDKWETPPTDPPKPESTTLQQPPPLSQILNLGRRNVRNPQTRKPKTNTWSPPKIKPLNNSGESSDESDCPWRRNLEGSQSDRSSSPWKPIGRKQFDISSRMDFPNLH